MTTKGGEMTYTDADLGIEELETMAVPADWGYAVIALGYAIAFLMSI